MAYIRDREPNAHSLRDADQLHVLRRAALRQAGQIVQAHREKGETAGDSVQFLSGFHKDDRLLPVLTIVMYFGSDPWDGPLDLHSMLEVHPKLLRWIDNHRVRLIAPAGIADEAFTRFHSELNVALSCIKYVKNTQNFSS